MLSSAVTHHPNEVGQWWKQHPVLFPHVCQILNVFLRSAVWRHMISLPNQSTLSVFLSPLWAAHADIARVCDHADSWTRLLPPTHRPLLALYVCDQAHWGKHDRWEQTAISPCLSSSAAPPPKKKTSFSWLLSSTGRAWQCWRCVRRTTSCKQPSGCSLLSAAEGRRKRDETA